VKIVVPLLEQAFFELISTHEDALTEKENAQLKKLLKKRSNNLPQRRKHYQKETAHRR